MLVSRVVSSTVVGVAGVDARAGEGGLLITNAARLGYVAGNRGNRRSPRRPSIYDVALQLIVVDSCARRSYMLCGADRCL